MFRQATNEEELKAQVLSKFLRMQEKAENLFDAGDPWRALLKYQTFVASLVLNDEEYEKVDEINKIINQIRKDALKINRFTEDGTRYDRNIYLNEQAYKVFLNVIRNTTKVLRDSGYYNFLLDGKKDFTDPSRGKKSFQRKK